MKKAALLFFLFFSLTAFSQQDSAFKIIPNSINEKAFNTITGIKINKNWKFNVGDSLNWASPDYDDINWGYCNGWIDIDSLKGNPKKNIAWFRIVVEVDSASLNKTLAFMLYHYGASEIYLDGKLIHTFGKIYANDLTQNEIFNPQLIPVNIKFENENKHLIAIRYSWERALFDKTDTRVGFYLLIGDFVKNVYAHYTNTNGLSVIFTFYFTFFFALGLLHFIFFLFYRANKSNLYYSLFALSFAAIFLLSILSNLVFHSKAIHTAERLMPIFADVWCFFLILLLYNLFYQKLPKVIWIWLVVFAMDILLLSFHIRIEFFKTLLFVVLVVESFRVVIIALIRKKDGAKIIGLGILTTISFFLLFFILGVSGNMSFSLEDWFSIAISIVSLYASLSIPISMSVLLARDFARTNKSLSEKLGEVEKLSEKTILQEKEKQKILETQKEVLEVQVEERLSEIVQQKKIIEEKNKDITESIDYAKTIQDAILPSNEFIKKLFPNSFVLYKPKDVVSGDFYWFAEKNDKKIIACCDCTGHGVPGAMMSIIGNNLLNQIINKFDITNTDEILNRLHLSIRETLNQSDESISKDGMDVSLLVIDKNNKAMFSGANRPIVIIRGKELIILKGNKLALGGTHHEKIESFLKHEINFLKDDIVYLFSDGFADQFNDIDEKLMTKRFYDLLLKISDKDLDDQKKYLNDFIADWQGLQEQTDDILVIGVKVD